MAGPCYPCVGTSLLVLVGLTLLLFTGIASSDDLRTRVQQDCLACDNSFIAAFNTYQSDFGKWNKAIDGAKFHCGRFAKIRTCYTDCLHDSIYTYSSTMKSNFEPFYTGICDPVCYVAVLPYCYASTVGSYDITKSCSGANMNQALKTCVQTELFLKQNCTGVCTRGQRKALFYFFSTMFQCTVPYQTANDCFTWSLYCSEAIFGYNGASYVDYANQTIMESNRLSCSAYSDAYRDCLVLAIDGDVVLGSEPYSVTYNSPCADLTNELQFLIDFDQAMLVGPFCNNPDQSFNETCQGYAAPITVTTSTHQMLTSAAVVTSGAPSTEAFQTTRAMPEARPITLLTTSAGGSAIAGRTIAAGDISGTRQSITQPLTTRSTTSAAGAPSAYASTFAIGRGEPAVGAGGPGSTGSRSSVAAAQPTSATRSLPTMQKPFAGLEHAYREIILYTGAASEAAADSTTVATLLAFAAAQWAGIGFA